MKIDSVKIKYCLSKKETMETEMHNPSIIGFYIPQIGSSIKMQKKRWKVAEIIYDYDKSEVTIHTPEYVQVIKDELAKINA